MERFQDSLGGPCFRGCLLCTSLSGELESAWELDKWAPSQRRQGKEQAVWELRGRPLAFLEPTQPETLGEGVGRDARFSQAFQIGPNLPQVVTRRVHSDLSQAPARAANFQLPTAGGQGVGSGTLRACSSEALSPPPLRTSPPCHY